MPSVRSGTTRGLVLSEASKLRAVLLAAVVVVLGAFGAGGWLSGRAADARSLAMSRERARSIASLVAAQSDLLLRSSDDAGVRRLMLDGIQDAVWAEDSNLENRTCNQGD